MYTDKDKARMGSGINVLAGLWLVMAPFFLGYAGTAFSTNDIVIGVMIAIIALVRFFTPMTTGWLSWVNVLLGLWLIISPFLMGSMILASVWNDIVAGLLVVVMAVWSASSSAQPHMRAR